jgi:hypothetical protein
MYDQSGVSPVFMLRYQETPVSIMQSYFGKVDKYEVVSSPASFAPQRLAWPEHLSFGMAIMALVSRKKVEPRANYSTTLYSITLYLLLSTYYSLTYSHSGNYSGAGKK